MESTPKSRSIRATSKPEAAYCTARLEATIDFPTPPFPLVIAINLVFLDLKVILNNRFNVIILLLCLDYDLLFMLVLFLKLCDLLFRQILRCLLFIINFLLMEINLP